MCYLCALKIRKTKFLRSFHLAKKKRYYEGLDRLSIIHVNNNRFEKLNTHLCVIYALLYLHSFNFCAASLKGLSF